jgi:hypothetical protein
LDPLATNLADTNGFFQFTDTPSTNRQRFYRVLGQWVGG